MQEKDVDIFTEREKHVMELIEKGMSNVEISKTLAISIHTTKAHVANILRKLDVSNRLQAVVRNIQMKRAKAKEEEEAQKLANSDVNVQPEQ